MQTTELKRLDALSCAKVGGLLYAILGLLLGGMISLMSVLGATLGESQGQEAMLPGFLFGIGAILLLPIFYGLLGAVSGALTALLYNLVARLVGGIKFELS